MVPSVEALPEIYTWMPLDAALTWRFQAGEGFLVTAFGARRLSPAALQKQAAAEGNDSWMSRFGRRLLGLADKPRAPPSSADPTALLRAELGGDVKVESEEDVLHLRTLPTFDGALRPRECELLLQYLTVPYLRVPLLLRFFSSASHVHALGNPKLQAALDAALFEPGLWQAEAHKQPPQQIPAPSRAHLATPAGILINELTRSPAAVGDSILSLTGLALELELLIRDALELVFVEGVDGQNLSPDLGGLEALYQLLLKASALLLRLTFQACQSAMFGAFSSVK